MKRPRIRPSQRESITWARICKRLRSPGIDSKEPIPPAYNVAWEAGTSNRVVVPGRQAGNRFLGSEKALQIRAQVALYFYIIVTKVWVVQTNPGFCVPWQHVQYISYRNNSYCQLSLRFFMSSEQRALYIWEKKDRPDIWKSIEWWLTLQCTHC